MTTPTLPLIESTGFSDGEFLLPKKYGAASRFVVRMPGCTVVVQQKGGEMETFPFIPARREEPYNPELGENEVSLKIFGEEPEIFQVKLEGEE